MTPRAPATELAARIGRSLIAFSDHSAQTLSWTPKLEQTLHQLNCRHSLSPSLVARVIDPHLINHHTLAFGFFNWASQQPGFSHSSVSYESLLKCLSISRQFNSLEKVRKQAKTQRIDLNSSIYRSVISSLLRGKKAHNAFFIFSEAGLTNCNLGPEVCNSLLAGLASEGYRENALKVFDEMCERDFPFSTLGFGVFVWRLCGYCEIDRFLGLLDEARKSGRGSEINGSVLAVLVVHGLCRASRVSDALELLEEMRRRDCKPDFIAYRIVAEAFREAGSLDCVYKVLKRKRKLGVAPRADDYRKFIFDLISERRIWEAKEMGGVIVGGNFPIHDDVLNALIGSVSTVDTDSALVFFKFMVGNGRLPTLLTLSNLSRNLCKHEKFDQLLEAFHSLSEKNYFLDMESYNVKISFLCAAGKVRDAYAVLKEMKTKGLCPDVSFYNSILEACCREDLLRPAKRLWDEMFASGCSGNLRTYNILIRKFSKEGQMVESKRLFHHMLEKNVAPDSTIYTSLLEGFCQERDLESAFEVFGKCVLQGEALSQTVLNAFILSLCKEGHFLVASEFLCGHLSNGIQNSASHLIMLRCLADAGEVETALKHIKSIAVISPSILQKISVEIMSYPSSSTRLEPILQLLQELQKSATSLSCGMLKNG